MTDFSPELKIIEQTHLMLGEIPSPDMNALARHIEQLRAQFSPWYSLKVNIESKTPASTTYSFTITSDLLSGYEKFWNDLDSRLPEVV